MLEIRTLGGLEILVNGEPVKFRERISPALCVYLAMTEHSHPRDMLVLTFVDEHIKYQRGRLRQMLSDLRSNLEDYFSFVGDHVGVNPISNIWVDALEFERLTEDGSDCQILAKAIDYYRGGFLDGFAITSREFEMWSTLRREHLHIRMTQAYEGLIDHHYRCGEYSTGIDYAMRFLDLEPEREKTYCWLMKLLACSGERKLALEQFDACCAMLATDGLTPESETLELYECIRSSDHLPCAHVDRPVKPVREISRSLKATTSAILIESELDIPARAVRLFGRKPLIDEINQALDHNQRVLLQGLGGIGKTALAAEVLASRSLNPDEPTLWLEVGDNMGDDLLEALVQPFNSTETIAVASTAKDQVVRKLLDERKVSLVVFDDAWDGPVLERLIKACPRHVPVLATSRTRYAVGKIRRIDPLELDDALELLSLHAYQSYVRGDSAAVELCETLGGHPYAIELAAKTMQVDEIGPDVMLQRYGDAPDTMHDPLRPDEAPVAALIATSLIPLDSIAQDVFFAFGALFTPAATSDLLARCMDLDHHLVVDALETLNRRGLAERYREFDGTPAFRAHDLAWAYARAGTQIALSDVLEACVSYAVDHSTKLSALDAEIGNLVGAAADSDGEQLVSILKALAVDAQYFEARGYSQRLLSLLDSAATAAESIDDLETAHYLYAKLGNAYALYLGQFEPAIEVYFKALDLAERIGDHTRIAMMLTTLGTTHFRQGEEDPDHYYDLAYELATERDDGNALAFLLSHRSFYMFHKDPPDYATSRQYSDEAVRNAQQFGLSDTYWISLLNRANAERMLGQYDSAMETIGEAYALAVEQGNQRWQALALFGEGEIYHSREQRDCAQDSLERALRLYWEIDAPRHRDNLIQFMKQEGYTVPALDE